MDLNLEAAAIIASRITQALEGARLKVFYLAERVCYQLASVNAPQVPMDPSEFMLAPRSMTITKYDLWGPDIPYTEQVMDELDYDEFSETCLMPSLTVVVGVFAFLIFLQSFIVLHSCTLVIFKWNTCVRLALLLVLLSTFPLCRGPSMLMVLMALLGSILLATI